MNGCLRRGLGWKLWAFALPGFIVLACAGTSPGPRQCQPAQQAEETPKAPVAIQSAESNFTPASGSQVELQGTATIGSWKSQSTDIQGKVVLETDATALNDLFDRIQSALPNESINLQLNLPARSAGGPAIAEISVPVMSLHGDSGGMDRDMQDALKVGGYPSIEYLFQELKQAELQWDSPGHPAGLKLRVLGTLIMAGAGRPITMDVIVTRDSRRHFLAHAQTELSMTDFGVTPPRALFGLIKANERVVVVFDVDFVLVDHSAGR
jgi:YceI-like domain